MGFIGTSQSPSVNFDSTPTIYNLAIADADTEQSQALPANTKDLMIKTRGQALLKIAFVSGQSGTNYITIPANAVFHTTQVFENLVVYFQSPSSGDIVEILAFS